MQIKACNQKELGRLVLTVSGPALGAEGSTEVEECVDTALSLNFRTSDPGTYLPVEKNNGALNSHDFIPYAKLTFLPD